MPPSPRPTYTRPQLVQYLDRLDLPDERRIYDVAPLNFDHALAYLTLLQKAHLATIPFENLSLHYSPHRRISIHPEAVFQKIIGDRNGRGGYCMEITGLFAVLLHSLGFDCYSAGARVFSEGCVGGWSHMVVIVKLKGRKYHVDVGFGPNGPIAPMPLDHSAAVHPHIAPASARLQWKNIKQNTDPDQRLWVYEHRIHQDGDFDMLYCFTELEFLHGDYQVMNLSTSTSPTTFFTQKVLIEKKLLGDDGEIAGSIIVGQDIKWRVHGEKERVVAFRSEDDRVRAIAEHFGIKLSAVERESIVGMVSQIR